MATELNRSTLPTWPGPTTYGGGKWRLYLLPRDINKMVHAEHPSEVDRALELCERGLS